MTAKNKDDFLFQLHHELHRIGVDDNEDIFADFEEHFRASAEQGMTEEETCAKLGDVKEIARSYIDIDSTMINSIVANAIEDSRPHVSLTKPGRSTPVSVPAERLSLPAADTENAPIRELTPEHIAKEQPAPSISAAASEEPIREITPEHIAKEQPAPSVSAEASETAREVTPEHIAQEKPIEEKSEPKQVFDAIPVSPTHTGYCGTSSTDNSHKAEIPPQPKNSKGGFKWSDIKGRKPDINVGKLIVQIVLDVCVYSWALPILASLIFGFITTVVFGVGGAALGAIFGGFSMFHFLSNIFLGAGLAALTALLALLGVQMVKGFVKIIKSIVIAHVKAIYDL